MKYDTATPKPRDPYDTTTPDPFQNSGCEPTFGNRKLQRYMKKHKVSYEQAIKKVYKK